ncbi:GGDEF domain-containing protein [Blastococcus montanus]|uniref:GGDEF domain-containing protein n=1 Tax=Blastococcus montanus TaxID=3144973 RepID=UPI00320B2866
MTTRTLRARDPQVAVDSAAFLLLASTLVLLALPLFGMSGGGTVQRVAHWIGVATLVGAALVCRLLPPERLDRWHVGLGLGLGSVVLIAALNLATADSSAGAQACYAFPVLWVAVHLRGPAVALVTTAALAADLITLLVLMPTAAAIADVVFFGAVLAVIATLLVRANRTQDELVDALQRQLTVDSLTGLATRRAFDQALETSLSRSVPGGTALVLIDVDSFKSINDNHGHPIGDDVLVHLAAVLRHRIRSDDAVLSRLGGDEIAVLLPGCGRDVAARRAEELLDAVRGEPLPLPDGTLLALSISLGVGHVPRHSRDRRGLYCSADAALYEAKRAGRGRVALAPA